MLNLKWLLMLICEILVYCLLKTTGCYEILTALKPSKVQRSSWSYRRLDKRLGPVSVFIFITRSSKICGYEFYSCLYRLQYRALNVRQNAHAKDELLNLNSKPRSFLLSSTAASEDKVTIVIWLSLMSQLGMVFGGYIIRYDWSSV